MFVGSLGFQSEEDRAKFRKICSLNRFVRSVSDIDLFSLTVVVGLSDSGGNKSRIFSPRRYVSSIRIFGGF
ncbi:unnamed protein product [Cochlearia groenlandica]